MYQSRRSNTQFNESVDWTELTSEKNPADPREQIPSVPFRLEEGDKS